MKELFISEMTKQPRGGQARLARALGTNAQTVNKWSQGHNAPESDQWPAIEDFFGISRGSFLRAAGLTPLPTDDDIPPAILAAFEKLGVEIRQLRAELAELRSEVPAPPRSSGLPSPTS